MTSKDRPKDAGGASSEPQTDFVIPSEDLQQKIVSQVEYYFSDENIIHDAFMLKHVRRNKHGFVSLKLVSSFRKIKPMTRDYRVVAYSIRHLSKKLEVNEEGVKVRRIDLLPDFDETIPSRSLVIAGLLEESSNMEAVTELIGSCGEIVSIRIIRPGKPLSLDVKKLLTNLGQEYLESACALVEFDAHKSAVQACDVIGEQASANNTQGIKMKASLLMASKNERAKKTTKSSAANQKVDKKSENENWRHGSAGHERHSKSGGDQHKSEWKRTMQVKEMGSDGDIDSAGSESDAENWRAGKRSSTGRAPARSSLSPQVDPNCLSPGQSPRTTPRSTPKTSPKSSPWTSPNLRRKTHGTSPLVKGEQDERRKSDGSISSPSQSPWIQRRLKAHEASVSPLAGNSASSSPRLSRKTGEDDGATTSGASRFSDSVGVIRQPRGPDGTCGFHAARGNEEIVAEKKSEI